MKTDKIPNVPNAPQSTPIPPVKNEQNLIKHYFPEETNKKEAKIKEKKFDFPLFLPEEIQMKIIKEVESNLIKFYFPGWIYGCRLCYGCQMSQKIHIHKDKSMRAGGGFAYRKTDLWNIKNAAFLRRPLNSNEMIVELPEKIENEIKRWTMEILEKVNKYNKKPKRQTGYLYRKKGFKFRTKTSSLNRVTFGAESYENQIISPYAEKPKIKEVYQKNTIEIKRSQPVMHTFHLVPGDLEEFETKYSSFPGCQAPESFKNRFHKKENNAKTKETLTNFSINELWFENSEPDSHDNQKKVQDEELLVYRLQNDLEIEDFSQESQEINEESLKSFADVSEDAKENENGTSPVDDKTWLAENFGIEPSDYGIGTKHILNYRQAFQKRIPSFIKLPIIYDNESSEFGVGELTESMPKENYILTQPIGEQKSEIVYDNIYQADSFDDPLNDVHETESDTFGDIDYIKSTENSSIQMQKIISKIDSKDIENLNNSDNDNLGQTHSKSFSQINLIKDFVENIMSLTKKSELKNEKSRSFLPKISTSVLINQNSSSSNFKSKINLKREDSLAKSDSEIHSILSKSRNSYLSGENSFIFDRDEESLNINLQEDLSLKSDSEKSVVNETLKEKRKKIKTMLKQTKMRMSNKKVIAKKENPLTAGDLGQLYEPLDFLSKYCIIHEHRLPAYENVFQSVLESQKTENPSRSSTMNLNVNKTKKRKRNLKKKPVNLLTKREESFLRKDVIYNRINYQPPPGQNYTEIEIQKIKFQIQNLLEKREELKNIYDNSQDSLENEIAMKIKEKYPKVVEKLKYSKSEESAISNKEIVKKIDSLIRKKISKMNEFLPKWAELNQIRKTLNQITVKILNLKIKRQKLELLKSNQRKAAETNPVLMSIKREESIIYQTVHPDQDKEISIDNLESALQVVNRQLLSKNEFNYIYHILKLPHHPRINMQTFSCIAALSEKVTHLEPFTKRLLNKFDFNALDTKMEKAKKLFNLMSSRNDELPDGTVSVKNLAIELMAGGIPENIVNTIIHKFDRENKGYVDFLDYLTYIPLFVEIHERIINDPLDFKIITIDF